VFLHPSIFGTKKHFSIIFHPNSVISSIFHIITRNEKSLAKEDYFYLAKSKKWCNLATWCQKNRGRTKDPKNRRAGLNPRRMWGGTLKIMPSKTIGIIGIRKSRSTH